jgi:hypothetical protein
MFNKWYWLALLAGWLGWITTASAQYLPQGAPPPHMPEPLPVAASPAKSKKQIPPENLIPGPLGPEIAPLGPSEDLSLPEGLPSAFPLDGGPRDEEHLYVHFGSLALQRSRLQHAPFSVLDPGTTITTTQTLNILVTCREGQGIGKGESKQVPATVTATTQQQVFSDTGPPPVGLAQSFGDFHELVFPFTLGVRGTIGVQVGAAAVELGGFYLPETQKDKLYFPFNQPPVNVNVLSFGNLVIDPGLCRNPASQDITAGIVSAIQGSIPASINRLDLPFTNVPPGFEGNNGLFLQANTVLIVQKTALGSAELNIRPDPGFDGKCHWLVGARYLNLRERLDFIVSDDPLGPPQFTADYRVQTRNQILAGQVGVEWEQPCLKCLALLASFKGGGGANYLRTESALIRGDGHIGVQGHRGRTEFSHFYEIGLFADLYLLERARLRAGYTAMWLVDVAKAVNEFDYNLANPFGHDDRGTVFFHGPSIELQIAF